MNSLEEPATPPLWYKSMLYLEASGTERVGGTEGGRTGSSLHPPFSDIGTTLSDAQLPFLS